MKVFHRHQPKSESSHSAFPSAETLLVVDDDRSVRELEAEILSQEGYSVLQADSAAQALRLAGEAAAIHLLITDYSMPEVNGLELARRFRAVHPKTPVLMVSGSFPLSPDETHGLGEIDLLPKPFGLSELLRRVRTLLDAAAPTPRRTAWPCH